MRPWGHARWRFSRRQEGTVRHRPRRASCTGCSKTHVLLSMRWLSRCGDAVSVIGSALLAKAAGLGHRRIAALLGCPACTVPADRTSAVMRCPCPPTLRSGRCIPKKPPLGWQRALAKWADAQAAGTDRRGRPFGLCVSRQGPPGTARPDGSNVRWASAGPRRGRARASLVRPRVGVYMSGPHR